MSTISTQTKYATLHDGIKIFYRAAGDASKPVVLLLHGFPSSSHQYRNLIPLLSKSYHVIAPDLPGFGFTTVPEELGYKYNFANLTTTMISFLDTIAVSKFSVYIFDYGAPVALRIALQRPQAITAIVTQNGNAYDDGLGADFWVPLRTYWAASGAEESQLREMIRTNFLCLEGAKGRYTTGTPAGRLDDIAPESYFLDYAHMELTPGNKDVQLDMLKDYRTNVEMYPRFQEYFRKSQVPLLAVWGKNDVAFVPPGAEAFKRDLPNAEVGFVDGGHFALETHGEEIAERMLDFLKRSGI